MRPVLKLEPVAAQCIRASAAFTSRANLLSSSPDHDTSPSASKNATSRTGVGRRLCFDSPARPVVEPAPAPVDPAATAVRHALARAHSAMFGARSAKYTLRDDYRPQLGRYAQLRAAIMRYREVRAAYAAAAAVFRARLAGAALQTARAKYHRF